MNLVCTNWFEVDCQQSVRIFISEFGHKTQPEDSGGQLDDGVLAALGAAAAAAARGRLSAHPVLDDLLRGLLRLLHDALCRALALVVLRAVLVGAEHLDGGEALHAVLAAQALVLVAVYGAHADQALERLGRLLVLGRQLLAVAAPRRVELDDPDAVRVLDAVVEVVGVEVDDAGALGVQGQRAGRRQQRQGQRSERVHRDAAQKRGL